MWTDMDVMVVVYQVEIGSCVSQDVCGFEVKKKCHNKPLITNS